MSSPHSHGRPRARRALLGALTAAALAFSPAVPALAAADAGPAGPTSAAAASGSTLTVADRELLEGEPLVVEWATDRPHALNWVGVYPTSAGTPDGSPGSTQWRYTPGSSGTVAFEGLPAGAWSVYLLAQDGYAQLAAPVEFTVSADPDRPQPGDPHAPVEIDPVATDNAIDEVVAREGFGADGATGWAVTFDDTMTDAGSDAHRGWRFTTRSEWTADIDEMRTRFGRAQDTIAIADPQQFGDLPFDSTLAGAPVPVAGLGAVRLTFDSHYRGAPGQAGVVEVSFDGGERTQILHLDSTTVADGYDARRMNEVQDVTVEVPAGAEEAVFSWRLTGDASSRYWAIDSVTVHEVLADAAGGSTQAWVMSDIQGHPQDWQHALGDYARIAPEADGMLLVGDQVNSGTAAEWDEIYTVMDATAGIRPRQTIAAIGNHERYAAGGFDANRDRFLAFAQRDRVWDEYVLEGPGGDVPVIVLGQEFAAPSDVAMSDAQVAFLEERLAHWTELDKQVVVMTHFPLGDTVSASWIPGYHDHHQMNSRLTSILGNYPNAVVFSGHTHYPAELGDWAVQRRTVDGHPDGFWAVNTLAMHVEWDARGEDTAEIREVVTRDIDQGLLLDAY
ncbi:metallophosphoesterase, partial [Microbacterium sp.]|uniref:metallophosphoesterase n=1 Tax=Microbacterium sp. TaxID=51671 RepID=UPI0028114F04